MLTRQESWLCGDCTKVEGHVIELILSVGTAMYSGYQLIKYCAVGNDNYVSDDQEHGQSFEEVCKIDEENMVGISLPVCPNEEYLF